MVKKTNILFGVLIILFAGAFSLPLIRAQESNTEITVIGSALIGKDPDRMYREALTTAFSKAYLTINKENNFSSSNEGIQDPLTIQKKLGISDYRILRYWQTDSVLSMEVNIIFGELKADSSKERSLSALPIETLVYQTSNPVISVAKNNTILMVNTTQTIDMVDPESGKLLKKIKTGTGEHDVLNDKYVVKEKDYLKTSSFNKVNILNLAYLWRQKLPDLNQFLLNENGIYVFEKNGYLKMLDWENGNVKWKIAALGLTKIKPITADRSLFIFTTPELWMVNNNGQKLWSQELEAKVCGEPVVFGTEIYCVLENATLKILNLTSGSPIGTWNLSTGDALQNPVLKVDEKEVFLSFNDKDLHGHLRAYQRYTGNLQWEASWNEAIADLADTSKDLVIVATGNNIEARETLFGLKAWGLPVNRKIIKLYLAEKKLTVAAGNRIYSYDLK